MDLSLKWLPDVDTEPWQPLASALSAGLPVPAGFTVRRESGETVIRAGYEQLCIQEKTRFVAVRGPSHSVLNVINPDPVMHCLNRLWTEQPGATILIQRMIPAVWCGKAQWDRKNLRVRANEGMMLLDPDVYVLNGTTGKPVRKSIEPRQRRMIRHVDGSARVLERQNERMPMSAEFLAKVSELATRANADIGWCIDDLEKIWLLSVSPTAA